MPPTVSVVMPVYNRFDRLKYAVESVLTQSLPVSEVILVDDGSLDGTSELLPQYIEENPAWRARVRYFHQENQGPNVARNTGIAYAKGEWLAFNDNDDLWLPQKLEWQFRALDRFKDQCDACITDAWFMNNPYMKRSLFQLAGKQHRESIGMIQDPLRYMLDRTSAVGVHPIWLQNLVTRSDLVRRVGGFDLALRYGDDDDFAFRLACETKFCFVNMPMVVIDRTLPAERHVGASKNWDEVDFRLRMAEKRMEKRLRMSEHLPAEVRTMIRRDLAAVHSGWANWFLRNGEYGKAKTAITEALRLHGTFGTAVKAALIRCTPSLTRKLVQQREEFRRRRDFGIG
ncbi:MAG: glycosyltransferase family A protein [Bryobacteraceae bacterium]